MSEAGPISGDSQPAPADRDFRWQGFFQRCRQPLFVLDRRRRILFVNRAWEELTGVPAGEARGLVCTRRPPAAAANLEALSRALYPPPIVLEGSPAHARRLVSGGRCWDLDFFPLLGDRGLLGILGRVRPSGEATGAEAASLVERLLALHQQTARSRSKEQKEAETWRPEVLLALRQQAAGRYRLDRLDSAVPVLRQAAEQVRLASQSLVPALILGEPGVGKEWLARAIHHQGLTAERPFAALDCGHLPPSALAAVLFGDGPARSIGFGTIYLNEPGQLPRDLQARLCDRLDGGLVGPRLLAGSRTDPSEEVQSGRLLEELRCALSTMVIRLPPLRQCRADLPGLVKAMLERAGEAAGRRVEDLAPEVWQLLRDYPWPGNLRELAAVLRSACVRGDGPRIEAGDLPAYLRRAVRLGETRGPGPARSLPLDELLEEAERRLIRLALERTGGHKARAADLLEVPRPRLFRRMKALGIAGAGETEADIEIEEPDK